MHLGNEDMLLAHNTGCPNIVDSGLSRFRELLPTPFRLITKACRFSGPVTVGADITDFRFDQPFVVNNATRSLSDYDIILIFGILGVDPSTTSSALAEVDAIAGFMEKGGGLFATGDHGNLGAEICGSIPRVRSVRRWYSKTGRPAPPISGSDRHDTTQSGADSRFVFEDQSDEFPQPIEPQIYNGSLPHPLLCSPFGPVDCLPDHMHEGMCEDVKDIGLEGTFKLTPNGPDIDEYPFYVPSNPPPGYQKKRLLPEVVATGKVLPSHMIGNISPFHDRNYDLAPTVARTFAVISAWDGHRVKKGRVVVDSSFHHFFNINLTGDRFLEKLSNLPDSDSQKKNGFYVSNGAGVLVPNESYRKIMWYFRNIIYWLIPANRTRIWWESFQAIQFHPLFREEFGFGKQLDFTKVTIHEYLHWGRHAEGLFTKGWGFCTKLRLILRDPIYKPTIPEYEWPQKLADHWDPAKVGPIWDRIVEARSLSAAGLGPNPDLLLTVKFGAALVTSMMLHQQGITNNKKSFEQKAEALLEKVNRHASDLYFASLRKAAEINLAFSAAQSIGLRPEEPLQGSRLGSSKTVRHPESFL